MASLDRTFTSAYGALGGATGSGDPWGDWVHSFYRRPHPELFPAALLHALRDCGGAPLLGAAALPASAFLASAVFRRSCATEADVVGVLGACAGAAAAAFPGARMDAGAVAIADAALETVLRGAWLAHTPACDAVLEGLAEERVAAVGALFEGGGAAAAAAAAAGLPPPPPGAREDALAAAASLFPPALLRRRAPLLRWPLPAADLASFEAHVREEAFPLYGASALWGARLRALRAAGRRGGAPGKGAAALLAPPLALAISTNMVEAYWAHFCATGDAAAVARVCDAAAGYGEFLDEFGLAPVMEGAGAPIPEPLRDDPLAALRFSSAHFALVSLLAHGGRHTAVGDAFAAQLAALNDEAVGRDALTSLGEDGGLTTFGQRRLAVMLALRAPMAEFAAEAWSSGVGSGAWPASYALLHGEAHAAAAREEERAREELARAQPHATAPAEESRGVGDGVEAPAQGAGFAAEPAGAPRVQRAPRLTLRERR